MGNIFFLDASPITDFEQLDYDVLLGSFLKVVCVCVCVCGAPWTSVLIVFIKLRKFSFLLFFSFDCTLYNIWHNLLAGVGEHN